MTIDDARLAALSATPVPRYTSYPVATNFQPSVNADVFARWLGEIPADEPISLYLHVPYCTQLCWYCACHTRVTTKYDSIARYRDALLAEIATVRRHIGFRPRLAHIHWGGGTPTILRPEDFHQLDTALRAAFEMLPATEIAVEIDPRTLSDTTVEALAAAGVTRASFGVQDFDPRVQAAINRVQSFATTRSAVSRLRAAGVRSVNIDLVYGLPLQKVDGLKQTIEWTLGLAPDRLALFGYAHVPWMKPHQRLLPERELPDARERLAQTKMATELLTGAGYVQIGIDHFARPEDSLARAAASGTLHRNFQGYTTDASPTLIGLGASAISSLPDGYAQNAADVKAWLDRAEANELATIRGIALDDDDRLRRDIIERLMCDLSVDLDSVSASHGVPAEALLGAVPALDDLARDGIAMVDWPVIRVAPAARPLVRLVAAAFDAYLAAGRGRHSVAV